MEPGQPAQNIISASVSKIYCIYVNALRLLYRVTLTNQSNSVSILMNFKSILHLIILHCVMSAILKMHLNGGKL